MFYYISFLRPPPLHASTTPNQPIIIMPQISNDLRTEYLEDPIDIYYAWSLHAPHPSSPVITKPAKLTSWRTSTAYKEIPVPRPPSLDGQHKWKASEQGPSWRLILTCGTRAIDQVVLLGETNTIGKTPFPVMSMPVGFPGRHGLGNNNTGKGAKQERISRSYSLRVPVQDRPIVFEITEQTSFDLDKKIWDSGIGLSSWLVQLYNANPGVGMDETLSDVRSSLFSTDARHILELGAGTGIVAITLAILRSTLDLGEQPGSVVTTDLPSAIPILQDNINANHPLTSTCVAQAAVLDWEHDEFSLAVQAQLDAGLDVIIMADVTYNTASFPALIGTLSRLIQHGKKRDGRPPKVLMGYKERHSDEQSLWDHARAIGLDFRKIAQVSGAGGNPIEIWLG
ncbi:putative methyltransferase-domain-containing protein [Chiua virens]|nr:putative methyltransferase-domain-containing protein [Chiua virens]